MRVFSKADNKTHPLEGFCRESGVGRDDDGKKWFFVNIHVTFACFAWESISTGHAGVRLEEQYESFTGLKNKCLYCQGVVHAGCSLNLRFSFGEKKGTESICGPCYENLGKPPEPLCANVHPSDAELLRALYKDAKTKFVNMDVTSL